jgi:hypothetical protein
MYIYKFTHIESNRCYIGKAHPNKGGSSSLKGRSLILVDGKRKWIDKGSV